MTPYNAASRYVTDAVTTMSPAQLLVMLYDRLVLDLDRAHAALEAGQSGHTFLLHAQEIVLELRSSLDLDAWDGAAGLASLYGYLHSELVGANVGRDAVRVAAARDLVVPLRDAWRQAALQLVGASPAPAAAAV